MEIFVNIANLVDCRQQQGLILVVHLIAEDLHVHVAQHPQCGGDFHSREQQVA